MCRSPPLRGLGEGVGGGGVELGYDFQGQIENRLTKNNYSFSVLSIRLLCCFS